MKVTKAEQTKTEQSAARILEISALKKALADEEATLKEVIAAYYEKTGEKMVGTDYQIVVRNNPAQLALADTRLDKDAQLKVLLAELPVDYIKTSVDVTSLEKASRFNTVLAKLLQKCKLSFKTTVSYSVKHA